MNTLEIETACPADLHTLADIERKIFDYDVVTVKRMKYLLKSKTAIVVKAVLNGRPIGYMILLTRMNSKVLRIYSLGVLQEERQLGFGRKLLQYAEKIAVKNGCERIHLELHTNNIHALIFYLSEGYNLYGRKKNYYTDGAQALLLRKQIGPEENHDSSIN